MGVILIFNILRCIYNPNGVEIDYTIDQSFINSQIPYLEDGVVDEPPGYPAITTISFLVGLPQEGKITWHHIKTRSQYIDGISIPPVTTMNFEGITIEKDKIYSEDCYYPDVVSVEGPFYFRDLRVLRVKIAPLRYNPQRKKLVINNSIKMKIKFHKKGSSRTKRSILFERILKEIIINYDQCQNWRLGYSLASSQFEPGIWYRIKTANDCVHKISYQNLKAIGINPHLIDPKSVKIYSSDFHTLPRETPVAFVDTLTEIPIFFQGEDDGQFDPEDNILFFSRGASWYTVSKDSLVYNLNPYTDTNCYWLTWGGSNGSRMNLTDGSPKGTPKSNARTIKHIESNEINLARSGLKWLWREILYGDSIYINHPDADGTLELLVTLYHTSYQSMPIQLYLNQQLLLDTTVSIGPNLTTLPISAVINEDSSLLKIERPGVVEDPIYLEYVDISYQRKLKLDSSINIIAENGHHHYQIEAVDRIPYIMDITNQLEPKLIYNVKIEDGILNFSLRSDSILHLYLTKEPVSPTLELVNPGRLRNEIDGADYIIITHDKFKNDILPLQYYRLKNLGTPDAKVMLVTLDEIFDEFAVGKFDPTAIRNFLCLATRSWQRIPSYVLFIGDGSYDYKNYLNRTNPPNFFPPYERDVSYNNPDANLSYDDWYAQFDVLPELIIGRLPIQGRSQLRTYIKKLIEYESTNYHGDWQNRLLLFADDEYGANHNWEWGGTWAHAANCESALKYVPEAVEPRKVYSMTYPLEAGNIRPAATQAFIDNLNEGVYLVIYYGHGNHHQIAHEKIFMYEDLPRINNGKKNFIIYFGSCGVSRFDDTKWESMGEDLMRNKNRALVTLGATRGTSTTPNLKLGNKLAELLWKGYPVGDAVFIAKEYASWFTGKLYQLFSDPAARSIASIDTLNLTVEPDTITPTTTGTIISNPAYEAIVYLRDSLTGWVHYPLRPPPPQNETTFTFQKIGSPIHRGQTRSESLTFAVPLLKGYHDPVLRVNIFKNGEVGMIDSIPVAGSPPPSADHEGPKVTLFYGGDELKDSSKVESPAAIIGRVEDPAGINIALDDAYSAGEYSFAAILNDDRTNYIDLRRKFVFDLNSYTKGTFRFTLELPEQHTSDTLTITALDNLFNPSDTSFLILGIKGGILEIEDFLVYPNPVRDITKPINFTFVLNGSGHGEVNIYTVSGRLVSNMKNIPLNRGFNNIRWQPPDIGNGTYLVQLTIVGSEGKKDSKIERFLIAH